MPKTRAKGAQAGIVVKGIRRGVRIHLGKAGWFSNGTTPSEAQLAVLKASKRTLEESDAPKQTPEELANWRPSVADGRHLDRDEEINRRMNGRASTLDDEHAVAPNDEPAEEHTPE